MAQEIGLIGLGAMGAGMGRNILARAGGLHALANRNRAVIDSLVAAGAVEHASAADLARACDVVVLCLPNSDVVEQVVNEMLPVLRPGQIVIDTGTSALPSTLKLAQTLSDKDVLFAEAPLTGGAQQAEEGQLGALVGASTEVFASVAPVLDLFCSSVQHFGPVGAGAKAKFVNNYMVMGIAALVTEAFHTAAEEGLDWGKLYDVVTRGSASSGVLDRVIGNAKDGDFMGYVFSVENAAKDMRYIADMQEQQGHATPLSRAVHDLFQHAVEQGHGARRLSELLRPEIRTRLFAEE
ncbi:3-hydroxyisobutyrate dehydrogenase [Roseovarius pacificus]|uniref:3-hydroxyisobutyrate dehydrogenase n=1 Tax=Roseovarius pacificus TaxID=337701 RepID=A0A1M7FAX2_9RHOB|nr:NAD(P)-dependent oxidoreductase [Roseovarius pacificus]GGO59046.1 3-hydroxyisobutyrate dehydrogenase/ 6-phosphogluconate dehydrogenase [Roseovarius pacificus]SHM01160.1 3-hydroxyisobutyrate dehydrogenase [Roseovarius pacificus]